MAQQNMNAVFYATTYHPIQAGSIDGTDTAAHDNGVYRALVASSTGLYDRTGDPKAEGDPYCTLFVGRLARHTTEKTLHEVMGNYGRVKHLRLVRHIVTGASRGYAFVEFENENDMQNAYEVAQHHIIDGSPILVDYNRQQLMPGWIPRRLGGGVGGRKESGQLRFGGRDRPFRAPLRNIPTEQLKKLGIPLPPVGRYMTRFQLPTIPRRPGSSKEGSHHRQKSSYRRSPFRETLPFKSLSEDERGLEQGVGFSPRLSRRSVFPERGSSSQEEGRSRRRAEGDAEENLSDKLDRGHEDVRLHKKRRRSEQENDEKSTRSGHEDREGSRYRDPGREYAKGHRQRSLSEQVLEQTEHETSTRSRHEDRESSQNRDGGHEYLQEHKKRSHSEEGDEAVDYDKVTRSGHEDRESSRYHKRSSSRSRHKHRDSGDYNTSSSLSGHKDKDGGHRHKRHRSRTSRESTAEGDRSPKHRSEHRRPSESKHRRSEE